MTILAATLLCLTVDPPAAEADAALPPTDQNGAALFLRLVEESRDGGEAAARGARQRLELRAALGLPEPDRPIPVAPAEDFQPDHRTNEAAWERADARFTAARTRPWKTAEYPDVAEWLATNREALDLLRKLDRRPEFVLPLLPGETADGGTSLFLRTLRPLCVAAEAEAMRLVGAGRPAEAWALLTAADRLARRFATGPGGTPALHRVMFSQSVAGMMTWAYQDWLRHAGADAAALALCRADLAALPPAADLLPAIAAEWPDAPAGMIESQRKGAKEMAVRHDLTHLAFALAEFKARRGAYPDRLDALVPEFLPELPADPFADGLVRYRRTPNGGFVAWSVGRDGVDERGVVQWDENAAGLRDDVAVHFPVRPDR